ncbi:hypothetical protein BD289DRAFT_481315 [Coniella lustricola]|uniref:Uncharacterized protein n=1 Tax=Coniella lustricola TaxID=2025994 RepID=A0A2T3ACL6_9PEZI|nr:hypothetical protein BD289DRAFT_481315 [Coniella lustricola]
MPTCQIPGHPAAYGLGIRLAFYLQWFGMILASWLIEGDALNLKFLNALTITATAIGLAVHGGNLQPAEVHVVLLLLCGTLYFLIPVYLLRFVTCWRPWWDTERWTRLRMGWLFRTAVALLFGALLGAQIWFWSSGVHYRPVGADNEDGDGDGVATEQEGDDGDCDQWAFLLGQARIDSETVTALNIVLHLAILVVACLKCAQIPKSQVFFLQQIRTAFDIIVASVVTAGIELVIAWNKISNVNNLETAAQLIPPVISGAYVARSIYIWMAASPPPDSTLSALHQHYAGGVPYFWGDGGDHDRGRSTGDRSYTFTEHSAGPRFSSTAADYTSADDQAWWYYWTSQRHRAARRQRHRRRHRRSERHQYDVYGAMPYRPDEQPVGGAEAPPEGEPRAAGAGDDAEAGAAAAQGDGADAGGDPSAGGAQAAADDGVAVPDPTVNPPAQPEAPV